MTQIEYRSLNWQDKQEAFWAWCEANDLDHTDPDSKEDFINSLKEVA